MGGIIEATCVNNAHPPNKQTNKQTRQNSLTNPLNFCVYNVPASSANDPLISSMAYCF